MLNKFRDADYCSYGLVEKMCKGLNRAVPGNCPKRYVI
jgi:hypothetical protein